MATTTTTISRSELVDPDFNHDGGALLHSRVSTLRQTLGDNAASRYEEYTSIADSTTVELDHNLGANLNNITVLLYAGSGSTKSLLTDTVDLGYTIAEKAGDEKKILEITTPGSGSPHTFVAIVIDGNRKPFELFQLLASAPATAPTAAVTAWFDTTGRPLVINQLGSIAPTNSLRQVHVSGNFNAIPGNHYLVDTSGGPVTATLNASIADYDAIQFSDATKTFKSNNLTIARNGNTIDGEAEDFVFSTNGGGGLLVGDNTTSNWIRSGGSGSGGGLVVEFVAGPTFVAVTGTHYRMASTVTDVTMPAIEGGGVVAFSPQDGVEWSTDAVIVTPSAGEQIDSDVADATYKLNMSGVDVITMTGNLSTTNWEVDTPITPTSVGNGAFVGDWESYTPTGTWTTNTTYEGQKRRTGDSYEYRVRVLLSGAPDATTLNIDIPDGTIDTSKLTSGASSDLTIGLGSYVDSGINEFSAGIRVTLQGSNQVGIHDSASGNFFSNTVPITWANSDFININFSVPILEFANAGTTVSVSDFSAKTKWVDEIVLGSTSTTPGYVHKFTRVRACRDSEGNYTLEGNIAAQRNSTTAGGTIVCTGVRFGHPGTSFDQAMHFYRADGSHASSGTGNLISDTLSASAGSFLASFNLSLQDKPDWFDAQVENSFDLDIYFQDASASNKGLIDLTSTFVADATTHGFVPSYEELVVTGLGGDYTGGTLHIVKIGSLVTISSPGTLTHASLFGPTSVGGIVPARFRPSTATANNTYYSDNVRMGVFSVLTDGTVGTTYRDSSGNKTEISSITAISISYTVL